MRLPAAIAGWWRKRREPKPLGYLGERAAERFLKRLGYKIVGRQIQLGAGELDIVAVDGRIIVFVEVKTRRGDHYGQPSEAVDLHKQRRMTRGALQFLKRHQLLENSCRFDVVAVTWPEGQKQPTIEHIKNAFEAVGVEGLYS